VKPRAKQRKRRASNDPRDPRMQHAASNVRSTISVRSRTNVATNVAR